MGKLTIKITSRSKGADRLRVESNTPFGQMIEVLSGERGWMKSPQGVKEMTGSERKESWRGEKRQLVRLFRGLEACQAQSLGVQDLDGDPCNVVYLSDAEGESTKLFLDPATHMIRAMEYKDQGMEGPVMNLTLLGDYRKAAGFSFPHEMKVRHNGSQFATMILSSIKVNPPMEDDLFTEPQ